MSHTPGPWSIMCCGEGTVKPVIVTENHVSLLTVVEEDGLKFAAIYEEADAHLIAAAPDLLNMLKKIRAQSPMFGGELGAQVDAVIAKATGGEV